MGSVWAIHQVLGQPRLHKDERERGWGEGERRGGKEGGREKEGEREKNRKEGTDGQREDREVGKKEKKGIMSNVGINCKRQLIPRLRERAGLQWYMPPCMSDTKGPDSALPSRSHKTLHRL